MGLPAAEDLPPSYTESITTTSPLSPHPADTHTPLPLLSSPLTTHLRTLPSRLRATQLARQTARASHDLALTDLLVPHIEAFLAELTSSASASSSSVTRREIPPVAELTLVPAAPVPAGWGMSEAVERRKVGEVVRVVRVNLGKLGESGGGAGWEEGEGDSDEVGAGSGGGAKEAGFDEWGRFDTDDASGGEAAWRRGGWWFTDEDMAMRLAAYLRPEPSLERKQVRAVVEERKAVEKEKSGWGRWGLGGGKKKVAEPSLSVTAPAVSPGLSSPGSGAEDDSVKMTVRAEEVTFRKENEFGLWESRTGWGIVVTIKVKR